MESAQAVGPALRPRRPGHGDVRLGTGNYTIDGVTFHVQDDIGVLNGSVVEYAAVDGTIYLETGRSTPDMHTACVHEHLHQHVRLSPHRWIYDVDDRIVDETCLKLVYRLGTDGW